MLCDNLKYFLETLILICRRCGIKMVIHMNDASCDILVNGAGGSIRYNAIAPSSLVSNQNWKLLFNKNGTP